MVSRAWRMAPATASIQARRLGKLPNYDQDAYIKASYLFNLSAQYSFTDRLRLSGTINNLFDKDPPLTTTAAIEDGGNGNTYPQFYDATGRYFFLSASVGF